MILEVLNIDRHPRPIKNKQPMSSFSWLSLPFISPHYVIFKLFTFNIENLSTHWNNYGTFNSQNHIQIQRKVTHKLTNLNVLTKPSQEWAATKRRNSNSASKESFSKMLFATRGARMVGHICGVVGSLCHSPPSRLFSF